MAKRINNDENFELIALDLFIIRESSYLTHQKLAKKLNVTFINKSKEVIPLNLLKLAARNKRRS